MTIFEGEIDSIERLIQEFDITEEEIRGIELLYCNYTLGSYEGEALVVFKKDGKLYEVNASHCSCYGLEGQWSPEETSKEAILKTKRNFFEYNDTPIEFLEEALKNE